jgi:hypothetical protein
VTGGTTPGGQGGDTGRGAPDGGRVVALPSSRETLAAFGASILAQVAGYGVLLASDLSAWLGWSMLAGGVALFGFGVRTGTELQRHYEEGGRVSTVSRALVWTLGATAGAGGLGAALLAVSAASSTLT